MPANVIFPVTFFDITTSSSDFRLIRNCIKAGIKHGQISISLLSPPFPFSEAADGLHVINGFGSEAK
ncbi:uncharacterized protein Dvar_30430 [Desulfosarcina variabilis str. Montpellier]